MSSVTEPTSATATRREPILICYDDSADAVRAIEAAAVLLGPRRAVVVDVLRWMTPAESLAATSSLVPGTAFEELNEAQARRIAVRGAEIARSAGFDAEPRGELAGATWEGIVGVADQLDAAVIVIGSKRLTGMKKTAFAGSMTFVYIHIAYGRDAAAGLARRGNGPPELRDRVQSALQRLTAAWPDSAA
jgi:nucleotide-binding universal stress UspA family protein